MRKEGEGKGRKHLKNKNTFFLQNRRKRKKIFKKGKYFLRRRRKTEKGNIWRSLTSFFAKEIFGEGKIFFGGEEKQRRERRKIFGDGKIFLGGEEKRRMKMRKVFGEGKDIFLWRRRKTEKGNEESIWRRKKYFFVEE